MIDDPGGDSREDQVMTEQRSEGDSDIAGGGAGVVAAHEAGFGAGFIGTAKRQD